MTKRTLINKEIDVTAVYFGGGKTNITFPRRIEFEGSTYIFKDGLQLVVKSKEQFIKIFTMNDASNSQYRIKNDMVSHAWMLESITQVN